MSPVLGEGCKGDLPPLPTPQHPGGAGSAAGQSSGGPSPSAPQGCGGPSPHEELLFPPWLTPLVSCAPYLAPCPAPAPAWGSRTAPCAAHLPAPGTHWALPSFSSCGHLQPFLGAGPASDPQRDPRVPSLSKQALKCSAVQQAQSRWLSRQHRALVRRQESRSNPAGFPLSRSPSSFQSSGPGTFHPGLAPISPVKAAQLPCAASQH